MPLPVAGERLAQPPSPENCTIREESRTTVRVSCAESEYFDANTATYVLQVFDADTRRLLASATSLTPSMLEVTNLPAERSQSGLVLSLRIMTAHAMSDATVLHSPHFVQEGNTNKEHQRYPGRAQIHNGSSYQNPPAPPPPYRSRPRYYPRDGAFCARTHRSDERHRRCSRASYENQLRRFLTACTIQTVLLTADDGPGEEYCRKIPEQTTRAREWYVFIHIPSILLLIRLNCSNTTILEFLRCTLRIVPEAIGNRYANRDAVNIRIVYITKQE